jgi:hypothetical protein
MKSIEKVFNFYGSLWKKVVKRLKEKISLESGTITYKRWYCLLKKALFILLITFLINSTALAVTPVPIEVRETCKKEGGMNELLIPTKILSCCEVTLNES